MRRSDSELVQSCLNGDAKAWDILVERYGRLIYSIPMRLGLSASDADDVFQTVMGIVLRRLATLRDESRLSAWLIRTTYRETWRYANKSRRNSGSDLDETQPDTATPADEQVQRLERQHHVRHAMSQLDDRCGELINALFFEKEQVSYEELAERLGMRVGSIGPTRARCFKKLERLLAGYGM